MSEMISVSAGFQYSVNIGYDLHSEEKLRNFIPTQSAVQLLEEVLLSTSSNSTERARILIGAYGKGKSHIALMILSVLLQTDISLFEKMLPKLSENPKLLQCVQNYYESSEKILPVVVTGSNTSLTQAFLLALQRTLSENDLLDIMPETNYRAAVSVIERWHSDFPDTYQQLKGSLHEPISELVEALSNYSISAYEKFEKIYPSLTAGSVFNPFLGFDVVELYESVAKSLKNKGYAGIYVVYDEFSKYLESNITDASLSDTKMLQDFAEKCCRSGELQLHLMLISHKEIANYIDKLPKQKVDGWRGVSERFKHIHLNNNFTQTYEIISSVIQKKQMLWDSFQAEHRADFLDVTQRYTAHPLFAGNSDDLAMAVYGCYPLHPVSTFILPRLSERVAQNERTLFTFLSAEGPSTLRDFLSGYDDIFAEFVTPDIIYDYFEPLFKKEVYGGEVHEHYVLAASVLSLLPESSFEAKIVKTISLIYILAQYERLKPTKDEIAAIYSSFYPAKEITAAIDNLIENEFVIYLKRSNNYLKIKQTSGIDIWQKIHDFTESHSKSLSVKSILNEANFDNYMYPSRYNDEREITRYFTLVFVEEEEVKENTNWIIKSEGVPADGLIYAVILHSEEAVPSLKRTLLDTSRDCLRHIFILPHHYFSIERTAREYEAVRLLRESASNDPVLFDEFNVIYEDLRDVINSFLSSYVQPEKHQASYIFNGQVKIIPRKAALTDLMSDICDNIYSLTPVICNEALNRGEITSIANTSRAKIISALLRPQLERNLGLSGSGQEVSIMRSTLIRTGIWEESGGIPRIILRPDNDCMANMMQEIEGFILSARQNGKIGFDVLYEVLTLPEYHIGLRKGLIPIYLAAVIHEYRQQILIMDKHGQLAVTADTLLQINAAPSSFSLCYIAWDAEKEDFIEKLAAIFAPFIIEAEKSANTYDYAANAMRRWMMSLPKYAKESKSFPDGQKMDRRYIDMMKLLRQNENSYDLLFKKLPKVFGYENRFTTDLSENIETAKSCFDGLMNELKIYLATEIKELFLLAKNRENAALMSLASVIEDWCETLDPDVFTHMFQDGTEKCLGLFKTITGDENTFIARLAKSAAGLRLEDWDSNTKEIFFKKIAQYKDTAEAYHNSGTKNHFEKAGNYQITFVDSAGGTTTKSFERIETSKRGHLLYRQISSALDAMGQAITEAEKRQILIEILQNLC